MKPIFGIDRELCKDIFYKECENDSGDFHFHSHIEICMVDEGETRVIINSEEKNLKKGDIAIAMSYDAHFYEPITYSKTRILTIPPYMCTEFIKFIENKKNTVPFVSNVELTERITKCLDELKNNRHNEILVHGYIYTILGLLIDNIQLVTKDTIIEHALTAKLLHYIHLHYKTDISIKTLAREFGYNQSYISRNFKQQFHIGIKKYITMLRLKNSIALMEQNKNISYCAFESGFNSLRTFYNAFTNEFNCTPSEYLKKKTVKII